MTSCDLEDIEDIGPVLYPDDVSSIELNKECLLNESNCQIEEKHAVHNTESIIPGTQKIWVKTWGCAHNMSDGEYMAGQLSTYGYSITENKHEADVWVLNSCTVKSPSEDHFRNEINKAKQLGKYVVLAGCVPQAQPKAIYMQGLSMLGVQQIDRIVEVVEETLKGHNVRLLGTKKVNGRKAGGSSLQLPKIRKNPLIEIIPISTGCLNQCTYCKTRHARGQLGSYSPEEIVDRAKQALSEGVVEIWLSSEDTGAYGRDIGTSLPELLHQLVSVIPEGAMLRIGMTNPPYMMEHLEEMSALLQHPRVYSFLHVPVQSGSDSVLMDMKREYCSADFIHLVDFLKARVSDVNIATDVICGFPTETEKDFEETMDLIRKYQFASLFINQFFPRPGTIAAKMPRLPPDEVKQRTKRVTELFYSFTPYQHKVNTRQKVLVTELSHDGQYYVAHNKCYDQVLVPKEEGLLGRMITVDIVSCSRHSMVGEIVIADEAKTKVSKQLKQLCSLSNAPLSTVLSNTQKSFMRGLQVPWLKLSVTVLCLAITYRAGTLFFSYFN